MALKVGHKDSNLRAADFKTFGARYGVPETATQKSIETICTRLAPWLDRLHEIGFDERTTENLRSAIRTRMDQLLRN